jgi:hypothetical protein
VDDGNGNLELASPPVRALVAGLAFVILPMVALHARHVLPEVSVVLVLSRVAFFPWWLHG